MLTRLEVKALAVAMSGAKAPRTSTHETLIVDYYPPEPRIKRIRKSRRRRQDRRLNRRINEAILQVAGDVEWESKIRPELDYDRLIRILGLKRSLMVKLVITMHIKEDTTYNHLRVIIRRCVRSIIFSRAYTTTFWKREFAAIAARREEPPF